MVRLATGGPVRRYCRFLAAVKRRLAASSVGAMALPLHPPCVLASLAFRAPESRQNLRPEPLTPEVRFDAAVRLAVEEQPAPDLAAPQPQGVGARPVPDRAG